jgi:hypothetical protein
VVSTFHLFHVVIPFDLFFPIFHIVFAILFVLFSCLLFWSSQSDLVVSIFMWLRSLLPGQLLLLRLRFHFLVYLFFSISTKNHRSFLDIYGAVYRKSYDSEFDSLVGSGLFQKAKHWTIYFLFKNNHIKSRMPLDGLIIHTHMPLEGILSKISWFGFFFYDLNHSQCANDGASPFNVQYHILICMNFRTWLGLFHYISVPD